MREVLEQDSDEEPEETRDFVPVFPTRSEQEDIMPDARVFYNIDIALELIGTDDQGLSRASKSKEKNNELQDLLQNLKSEQKNNSYILARTKGGLVTLCEDIVRILHEAEICFRKEVDKSKLAIRNIPVD
ncbi:Hypothetical predicted protein, partial [Paramuricea clavata]